MNVGQDATPATSAFIKHTWLSAGGLGVCMCVGGGGGAQEASGLRTGRAGRWEDKKRADGVGSSSRRERGRMPAV